MELIEQTEGIIKLDAKTFLEYCAKNKIDLMNKNNLLETENFDRKFIAKSKEEIKEVVENKIKWQSDFNYGKLKGGEYKVELHGEVLKQNRYAMNQIMEKIVKKQLSNKLKTSINEFDTEVMVLSEKISIYIRDKKNKYMLGTHKTFQDKPIIKYDFPSLPIDVEYLTTGKYTEEIQKKFQEQVVEYWKKYKIVKKLPNEIEEKLKEMSKKEQEKYLRENSKDYYEQIEFYTEDELENYFKEEANKVLKKVEEIETVKKKDITQNK